MSTSAFEHGLERLQHCQDFAHDREESAFEEREMQIDREEREREIQAENDAPLFNIPSGTWQSQWKAVRRGDIYALGFWVGVMCGSSCEDTFECEVLVGIASRLFSMARENNDDRSFNAG